MLPFFGLVDVRQMLPTGWPAEIDNLSRTVARRAHLVGGVSTSLESPGTSISYRLIDGLGVAKYLPWLVRLYETEFLTIAERFSARRLIVDRETVSSVNVNILVPGERGYEWHVDSNPVTGLLFLSSHLHSEGGMLEFKSADGHLFSIEPLAGALAVFDARTCPHRVTAPTNSLRISAPMNYFGLGEYRNRPDDLDNVLYGNQT
ncbi:2OG-Fe(II) oxygenase [Nocardia fluminea]|uniref:2OG-Fe(II) oxygenase n=1 Tax=Nocardia fluminea TaxID=134984 RepID=UPI00365678B7